MRFLAVDVAIGRSDQNDEAGLCGERRRGPRACGEAGRAERSAGAVRRVDAVRGAGIPHRFGPRAGGEASAGG